MPLRKLAFVIEDFAAGTPSQQLLDRFLMGYARDGAFRKTPNLQVVAWLSPAADNASFVADSATSLAIRERDFKLVQPSSLVAALTEADATIVAAAAERVSVSEELLKKILEQMPAGGTCFVHGCLATTLAGARRLASLAATRKVALLSGTSVATTFRLPDLDVSEGTQLAEALIVVQGSRPLAELWAIDALAPIIARRGGREPGIRSVRRLDSHQLWRAGDKGEWSWALLSSAISRSNTTQGDPVKDGRTQDLVGLGLVKKLAREPRGYVIEHRDGLRSTILVLDGVIADFNFAVRSSDGTITSAQLYRPPAPNRAEFDRLAAVLEDFFTTGTAPWTIERSLMVSQFIENVVV